MLLAFYFLAIVLAGLAILLDRWLPEYYHYFSGMHSMCTLSTHVLFYHMIVNTCCEKKNKHELYILHTVSFVLALMLTILAFGNQGIQNYLISYLYEISFAMALICTILTFWRLWQYHSVAKSQEDKTDVMSGSFQIILVAMAVNLLLIALSCILFSQADNIIYPLACFTSLAVQNILLCYCCLGRSFIFTKYNKSSTYKRLAKNKKATEAILQKELPLNKKKIEQYIRKYRPFLNPNFSLIDFAEQLGTNRTYISTYINKVYGMNFQQYLNSLRLKEVERLSKLVSYKDKEISQIVTQAGFGSYRSYQRVIQAQKEDTAKQKLR